LHGCSCGADHTYKLAAGDDELINSLAKAWAEEAEKVWQKKGLPKSSKKLTALYGKHFSNAIEEGYGQTLGGIDYDTPDGEMLKNLLKNVYQFSAAKNYTQLRQLTQALIDADGKLRSYSSFKKEAWQINDTHVAQWLKAEYELAVAGSQMASKWVDITNNPATKFLEFDVVMDSHTSDICRPLHKMIVSVADPMLRIYYPPNHFYCRTTVRQHSSGTPTPEHQRTFPEIQPMFQTNLGSQGLVFPSGHSYWNGTPAAVLQEALDMVPLNGWQVVENGTIRIHQKVDTKAKDFVEVIDVARYHALQGLKVDVLPTIGNINDPLYKELFKGAKQGKCPDLRIDGKVFVEVKAASKNDINTIRHAIGKGSKQADYVVVLLSGRQEYKDLKRMVRGKFLQHASLQVIELKMDEAYYRFTRAEQLK